MTKADTNIETDPSQLSLLALFRIFLGFGMLAFGGPVAQIAMIRDALVERLGWIDTTRFNRLLAVLQILPGPEAHELCVHMGMIARGRIGGVIAGLGFMLPGLLLMLAAGWLYTRFIAGRADMAAALLGVQIVVLAVILIALIRIGKHIVTGWLLGALAVASLIATVIGVPFWLPLIAAGLVMATAHRPAIAAILAAIAIVAGTALTGNNVTEADDALATAPVTIGALFIAGLKGGMLTFGGAYTAIPYVRADTVSRGWINDTTFLDGIALAGVLPAPLVIFATFVGYVAGGLSGALAITAGMFLPAFAFSLIFYERLEAIVNMPVLHDFLIGVASAVVGVIAATFLQLGGAVAPGVESPLVAIALFAAAWAFGWRWRKPWVIPAMMAAGGVTGLLIGI